MCCTNKYPRQNYRPNSALTAQNLRCCSQRKGFGNYFPKPNGRSDRTQNRDSSRHFRDIKCVESRECKHSLCNKTTMSNLDIVVFAASRYYYKSAFAKTQKSALKQLQKCLCQDTRGMRGKTRRADQNHESGNRGDEKDSEERIRKEGRPRTVAPQKLRRSKQRENLFIFGKLIL